MSAVTTALITGATITASMVVSSVLTVGSILYQRNQAKKLQAELARQADQRKGIEFTKKGEVVNLPVLYGGNKVGSLVTDHKVQSSYTYVAPTGYDENSYLPSPTTYNYNASTYYIESKIEALDVTDTDNPQNIRAHSVRVIWNGAVVYSKSYPDFSGGFGIWDPVILQFILLSTTYEKIEDSIGTIQVGEDRYFKGARKDKIVNGNTITYKYEVRKRVAYSTAYSFGTKKGHSGDKNAVLLTQNAIAFAGINSVVDIDFDGTSASNSKYNNSFFITTYNQGGVVDNTSVANGFKSTNYFTNTAYAACQYVLNRDDPQWNGMPGTQFYVEGQRIFDIVESNGTYSLSESKIYSANSALVMLDYLTNTVYGRGLSLDQIDLESFYKAKLVCDKEVDTKPFDGKLYGGAAPRAIKLYEYNDVILTENEVRANVDKILQSMGNGFLIWSGGKYKLRLDYPSRDPIVAADPSEVPDYDPFDVLIHPDHVFTDEDIIQDEINVEWPNAESKYNQVTIKFPNAFKNFKDDSVTWPKSFSDAHNLYLNEDNGQPLKTEISIAGIITPYHAMAAAEQMVRSSRTDITVKLKLSRKAIDLEPGDYFKLKSEIGSIQNNAHADGYEFFRVIEITYDNEMNCDITAVRFDYNNLAWNVDDFVAYADYTYYSDELLPPSNVLFTDTDDGILGIQSGKLTWTKSPSVEADQYIIEVSADNGNNWTILGETYNNEFDITGLSTGVYSFGVRSKTPLGRKSIRVIAEDAQSNLYITIQRKPIESLSVTITTNNGTVFRNGDGQPKILTANLYVGGVEITDYSELTFKWYYSDQLIYIDQNRNVLDYNGQPLVDPIVAAQIPSAIVADSTQSSSYNGSLREIIVGPEDIGLSTKITVEIGNI